MSEVAFLDKEFPAIRSKKRSADLVAKVKWRGQPAFFLFHIEAQSQQQEHFGQRMFRYFAKLHDKYKLPVYPIALLMFDSPLAAQPAAYQVAFPDLPVLEFRYRVVQLNNLSWRDFINHPNPLTAALMAKMKIDKKDRPRVKAECLRMFLTMRLDEEKAGLILEFVETYLELNAAEEKTFRRELATIAPELEEEAMEFMTSWEKRGLQRGLKKGLKEGLKEGEQKGRQEGQQEKAREIVLRQLQLKLGMLSTPLTARLQTLSVKQLDQLSLDLFSFASVADLTAWLEQHVAQGNLQPVNGA